LVEEYTETLHFSQEMQVSARHAIIAVKYAPLAEFAPRLVLVLVSPELKMSSQEENKA
jgi:hypothetical protein